jgi:hypothetical protein
MPFQYAKRLADTNPVLAASWVMGLAAVALPFVVVPIREGLGLSTTQYTKISKSSLAKPPSDE